ncbi:MAG TPA: hypothetical protein PKD84_09610 [Propionicimonas sp.]|nr:hypothetical protein [Propionicimonas sp.]
MDTPEKQLTPKQTAWAYLIAGIVCLPISCFYLYWDMSGAPGAWSVVFGWAAVAMSLVALWRGITGLRRLK